MGDTDAVEGDIDDVDRLRLDVAGLDGDGEIVVVGEAERLNNDSYEAIPADYDKMAACDPEEAIWVTLTRDAAHDVLSTLNDPTDGEKRAEQRLGRVEGVRAVTIDGLRGLEPRFTATLVTVGVTIESAAPTESLRERLSDAVCVDTIDRVETSE